MKIIIIGAGELGFHLSKMLSAEKHDIVVIDVNGERLRSVEEALDVLTIQGSGTDIKILQQAGMSKADLLIAVTLSEEVNFTSCILASRLGSMRKIIRVRNPSFLSSKGAVRSQDFGIDLAIYPEGATAQEIVRLIRRSAATEVLEFADGRIQLLGLKLDDKSPLVGKQLGEVIAPGGQVSFRTVCISRGLQTIIPKRTNYFQRGDQIFVISKTEAVPEMLRISGKDTASYERIMILGGDGIGQLVAKELENELSIKLLESNKERSQKIAEQLTKTMVLHDEGKDLDLLASEGIIRMDAYIAVSPDEEHNIISCLMAKHLGVKKTVALVEKMGYIPFSNAIGIDGLVNKKLSAATAILKFIRKGEIVTAATLHGVEAEVMEMVAQEGSRITKKAIGDMDFPVGAIIGCVMHNGGVTIPVSSTRIEAGDRVVVFTLPKAIHDVERFFK